MDTVTVKTEDLLRIMALVNANVNVVTQDELESFDHLYEILKDNGTKGVGAEARRLVIEAQMRMDISYRHWRSLYPNAR